MNRMGWVGLVRGIVMVIAMVGGVGVWGADKTLHDLPLTNAIGSGVRLLVESGPNASVATNKTWSIDFNTIANEVAESITSASSTAVSTVPELAELSGEVGEAVTVLGYTEAGDGGGGTFYAYDFLPTWSATTNAMVIARPNGGYWIRMKSREIYASWFPGGNWATRVNAALSAARTNDVVIVTPSLDASTGAAADITVAGKTLQFGQGSWNLGVRQIWLQSSGSKLIGEGRDKTRLLAGTLTSTTNAVVRIQLQGGGQIANCVVSSLSIVGPSGPCSGTALYVLGGKFNKISDVGIALFRNLSSRNANGLVIECNDTSNNCHNNCVDNIHVSDTDTAIRIKTGGGTYITGYNKFYQVQIWSEYQGIYIEADAEAIAEDHTPRHNFFYGIMIQRSGSTWTDIYLGGRNNMFYGVTFDGEGDVGSMGVRIPPESRDNVFYGDPPDIALAENTGGDAWVNSGYMGQIGFPSADDGTVVAKLASSPLNVDMRCYLTVNGNRKITQYFGNLANLRQWGLEISASSAPVFSITRSDNPVLNINQDNTIEAAVGAYNVSFGKMPVFWENRQTEVLFTQDFTNTIKNLFIPGNAMQQTNNLAIYEFDGYCTNAVGNYIGFAIEDEDLWGKQSVGTTFWRLRLELRCLDRAGNLEWFAEFRESGQAPVMGMGNVTVADVLQPINVALRGEAASGAGIVLKHETMQWVPEVTR